MNLINFHKHPKNKNFIKEITLDYNGQGLIYSYCVLLVGNGHNKYKMTVKYDNKEYKIYIEEQHIIEWQIMDQPIDIENSKPYDSLKFKALGKLDNGQYIKLESYDYTDFIHLNKNLEVIDIEIENDDIDIEIINNIKNTYEYSKLVSAKRIKNIENILNSNNIENYDLKMIKINYDTFVNEKSGIKQYFFIFDYLGQIIPFRIINIETVSSDEHILEAEIDCNNSIYNIKARLIYFSPEYYDLDEYNIKTVFEIKSDHILNNYNEQIDDFCYIAI
jgi:hypothetical protein